MIYKILWIFSLGLAIYHTLKSNKLLQKTKLAKKYNATIVGNDNQVTMQNMIMYYPVLSYKDDSGDHELIGTVGSMKPFDVGSTIPVYIENDGKFVLATDLIVSFLNSSLFGILTIVLFIFLR